LVNLSLKIIYGLGQLDTYTGYIIINYSFTTATIILGKHELSYPPLAAK